MEDSGFDSEEKLTAKIYSKTKKLENTNVESDDDYNCKTNIDISFHDPNYDNKEKTNKSNKATVMSSSVIPSTCKILQRKLELKVERAKNNYNQFQERNINKPMSSSLVPINRLPIPGYTDNQPLVNYKSDDDDDDIDEISFFPLSKKLKKSKQNQQLSDTFSIQEMIIESDDNNINSDDSECSQNLELLPPKRKKSLLDSMLNCFYCMNHGSDIEE